MAHDEAYYEAEKKIQEALQSGSKQLFLNRICIADRWSNRGNIHKLTELPESIGKLTHLTLLNLSDNQLTALPDSMGKLTRLKELAISNNQLTSLPDSLGQLTQLTSLNLSDNQLTALPEWLGQLTQLGKLYVNNNFLVELPDSLGNSENLKTLVFANNQITTLPKSFLNLQNLDNLGIGANPLIIPEWIGQLTKLREVGLGYRDSKGNPLGTLPLSIRGIKQLQELVAVGCELTEIPDWIGELKLLRYLWFSNNKLEDLPVAIAQLEHLDILNLDNNPLNSALQNAYNACKPGKYEPLWAYLGIPPRSRAKRRATLRS